MEVIVRIDNKKANLTFLERMELIQRIQESMVGIPDIGCTMSATTFAPSLEVTRKGPLISKSMMRTGLNRKLADHRDEYLASDFVAQEKDGTELWRISASRRAQRCGLRRLQGRNSCAGRTGNSSGARGSSPTERELISGPPSKAMTKPRPRRRNWRMPPPLAVHWASTPFTPVWCQWFTKPNARCSTDWLGTS